MLLNLSSLSVVIPSNFTLLEQGNNFAVNIKSKGRHICNSKNHKLKLTRISLHRNDFKPIQQENLLL